MRLLALTVGVGLLATACADEPRDPTTELTVTVWPEGRKDGGRSLRWTLTCDPAGGTHPAPEAACSALAEGESALDPVPPDRMCTQLFGGPQVAHVSGTYRGREVAASFDRSDGCQIARWDALAPVFAVDR